jgi:radical SAM superfamily enzyme YgiQ (UPF0313 family)
MRQTVVGTVQINNSFSGQAYYPYSVGVLQAYAQKTLADAQRYCFLTPVFQRIPIDEAVQKLLPADVVGFSMYVWNARISLAIAQELKRQKPGVLIVFGGPHVPNAPSSEAVAPALVNLGSPSIAPSRAAEFLIENPFIDIAVHGEGEKPFAAILENLDHPSRVPSISYREDGRIRHTKSVERMKNLDDVPSPYLEGVFDGLIESNPGMEWIAVWETNRGCPFGCTFCDWGSNTNAKIGRWGLPRLLAEFDWFAAKKTSYVFCADANFGILPHDLDIAKYCVDVKRRAGYPARLSVQNTKATTRDAMEKSWAVQKVLSDGGLNQGVVVSMQSLHLPTLKAIKRDNMKREYFEEIQRRFTEGGVETMSDLILGMPEETYDSFADGVSTLITRGQHNRIQFNNCSILPNAEMGDPAYQRHYGMETVTSKIVNIHGAKSEDDAVPEYQDLVISTNSMPRADWVRARAYAWMAGLLHFDKVLQIPLVIAHEISGASYRELIEAFTGDSFDASDFPVIARIRDFFLAKARDIQNGGEEYCHSPQWLDMWWPADELILIETTVEGKLDVFYGEALRLLRTFLQERTADYDFSVLEDAVRLNHSLVKQPFQSDDFTVELSWNVWEAYQGAIRREPVALERGSFRYRVDRASDRWDSWEDWCRRVVWWGNKRGAYLYGNAPEPQLAGHF